MACDVEVSASQGIKGTTVPLNWSEMQTRLPGQDITNEEDEWEVYDEPIWDPLKSEVRLLVKEYFEQADADSEYTQR